MTGVIGLITTLAAVAELRSCFATREITPAVEKRIEAAAREVHQHRPVPGVARDRALAAAVEALATSEQVSVEEANEIAIKLSRRLVLTDESLQRGLNMARAGRYEQARREFLSATTTDAQSPAAWSNLAASDALLAKYDEAREAYVRALTLTPSDWRVRYNLGLLFARTGDPEEGLKHVSRAIAFLRSSSRRSEDLDAVLHELRTDPGLGSLRQTTGFAALVGG